MREGSVLIRVWVSLSLVAAAPLAPPCPAGAQTSRPGIVVAGRARFTVLTDRLLRIEWAADGRFEDRPSLVFLRGTTRTLDGVKGATSLEPGLVSRDGWAVVDDSTAL